MKLSSDLVTNIPTNKVEDKLLERAGVTLLIRREDLVHPYLSGNKYYKLRYNLKEAVNRGDDTILTFGGAYSNHIYATAAAGKVFNFKTIGIIRGEKHKPLNPTLSFAERCGMQLHYVSRATYRNKTDPEFIKGLSKKYGRFFLIPEGGSNALAVKGCTEIVTSAEKEFDYVCCPVGTGGTLAGLIAGLSGKKYAIGFAVLKGANFLNESVNNLLISYSTQRFSNWNINLNYHFGGYAKINSILINFVYEFQQISKIPIEPIYTGKMLFGIYDLVKKGFFQRGTTILAVHTGGLQGLRGLESKMRYLKNIS